MHGIPLIAVKAYRVRVERPDKMCAYCGEQLCTGQLYIVDLHGRRRHYECHRVLMDRADQAVYDDEPCNIERRRP